MEHSSVSIASDREVWNVFGHSIPKLEVVYFSQVIALYLVICTCLINLSFSFEKTDLWCTLLSASIGYLLPNPSLKREKIIFQRNHI